MTKANEANHKKEAAKEAEPKGPTNTIMGTGGVSARIYNSEFTEKDKLQVITHSKVNKISGITRGANLQVELKDQYVRSTINI